ncbi:IS110 family transposase [Streptomyces sp. NPDC002547]
MVGGLDIRTNFCQAAVIEGIGRRLVTAPFPSTPDRYRGLLEWMRLRGDVLAVGVEGTGAYGSELVVFLRANAGTVADVDRPDRKARRINGKSAPVDTYAAATAVLSGRATVG